MQLFPTNSEELAFFLVWQEVFTSQSHQDYSLSRLVCLPQSHHFSLQLQNQFEFLDQIADCNSHIYSWNVPRAPPQLLLQSRVRHFLISVVLNKPAWNGYLRVWSLQSWWKVGHCLQLLWSRWTHLASSNRILLVMTPFVYGILY